MKKRKGVIRYTFDDGTKVDRPVDDKRRAIPRAGFMDDDGAIDWAEPSEHDRSGAEWWQVQDALDDHVQSEQREEASKQGNEVKKADATDRHEEWQMEADKVWSNNPTLSKRDVAKRIARNIGGNPDYIRKLLLKK